jgi:hypothetical protein
MTETATIIRKVKRLKKRLVVPKKPRVWPIKYPFAYLDVGDGFFVPNKKTNTLTNYASMLGRLNGKKYRTRMTWMTKAMTPEDPSSGWKACDEHYPGAVYGIGVRRIK